MPNFAILRTTKLKTMGNIGGSSAHVNRTLEEDGLNIDPSRTHLNQVLVGSDNPIDDIKNALPEKPRKNAVLAVEVFIGASPEFFIGKTQKEIRTWSDESVKSMGKKWGAENVVSATLHMDETTPHIHMYVVPKIDGKLNCREFLGGKAMMQKMQSDYANDMQKFGLVRGLEGSKAKHKTPAQVGAAAALQPKMKTVEVNVVTRRTKNIIGIEKVATKKIKVTTMKSAKIIESEASKVPLLKHRNDGLMATIKDKDKQLKASEVKASVSALRETDLMELALKLGYQQDQKDPKKWLTPEGTVSINGQKFFDHSLGKGSGGAIDFVMYCEQSDYKNAVSILSSTAGMEIALSEVSKKACREVAKEVRLDIDLQKPEPMPEANDLLKDWLTNTRKIPAKIVDSWIDKGKVYATKFRNSWQAIFVHNENAFFKQNPHTGFKGWVKGSEPADQLCFVEEPNRAKKTAVVEGHIDGLSLQALRPNLNVCIAATAGAATKIAKRLEADGHDVIMALDNDPAGKKVAEDLPQFESITSSAKDWSDDLVDLSSENESQHSNTIKNPSTANLLM